MFEIFIKKKALCRLLEPICKMLVLRILLFDLWFDYYSTIRRKKQGIFARLLMLLQIKFTRIFLKEVS